MINSIQLFIGLRYLKAKQRNRFVSFVTLTSVIGVSLGVAALIVILSVMNGFEGELRERLLSMSAHGYLEAADGSTENWESVVAKINKEPGVIAAAPFVQLEGMIRSNKELFPIMVHGVDYLHEKKLSGDFINIIEGNLKNIKSESRNIILGRILAYNLNVNIGDRVILLIPKPIDDGTIMPVLESFSVKGIFEVGLHNYDASIALANLKDLAKILDMGSSVTSIRYRADNVFSAPRISQSLQKKFGSSFKSNDWSVENESYFRAIRLEKMMMSLILSLIIGVAAFNIVASLVMVVTDKKSEIAVLRTLGMTPKDVVNIFFIQGILIGWVGVILGVILGTTIAINIPTIVPALEQFLNFQIMPGDVYYITEIPSNIEIYDILLISVLSFLLTSIATLYPARKAALVNPASVLRDE
ncbi:MAG: lipoprotein-releasing system transmembrane subunit LolC [Gammaproteobacteria bacterium]|nr:lipoprotein-releasing system transmembrane subunit LolC [Gammaproteobacteria bacterium]|tara:strand:- start:539 stop:1783 length:1245 start_codon:yes stop_codon:yes gene_type:complete